MTTDNNEPSALEAALELATTEPAHRPEFLRLLLESTILVLGNSADLPEGETTLQQGATINIEHWLKQDGSRIIPFFTSVPALIRAIEKEENYLALPARAFFEMTRGSPLVLNPQSDYGKEFFPEEIEALLTDGVGPNPVRRVYEEATQVLLGQPKDYPVKMVESLTKLFAKHPQVSAAYLALMHEPSRDELPHLVVGVLAEGDIEALMRDAGSVAADTLGPGEYVDFTRVVVGQGGISLHFLESVKPFYERSWGSKLRSFFGSGNA